MSAETSEGITPEERKKQRRQLRLERQAAERKEERRKAREERRKVKEQSEEVINMNEFQKHALKRRQSPEVQFVLKEQEKVRKKPKAITLKRSNFNILNADSYKGSESRSRFEEDEEDSEWSHVPSSVLKEKREKAEIAKRERKRKLEEEREVEKELTFEERRNRFYMQKIAVDVQKEADREIEKEKRMENEKAKKRAIRHVRELRMKKLHVDVLKSEEEETKIEVETEIEVDPKVIEEKERKKKDWEEFEEKRKKFLKYKQKQKRV